MEKIRVLTGITIINAIIAVIIIVLVTAIRYFDSGSYVSLAEEYAEYARFDTSVSLVLEE